MVSETIDFSERDNDSGVDELFIRRWSPRAFQPYDIDQRTMQRIMDAARWSPSCFNAQPWRFFTSSERTFDEFLDLLVEGNQAWAKNASVLGFAVGQKNFEHNGKPNDYTGFDSGAAWMSLSLQARIEGFYTHGMGGIKKEEATNYFKIDTKDAEILMGFAIGKLADLEDLDEEQRAKEIPNDRKALAEIWTQL